MNAITTSGGRALGLRPTPQDRPMADLISRYTNRLEETGIFGRMCISGAVAPSDADREVLGGRKAHLIASLEPDGERSRKAIGALLGSFPSYGEDDETARFTLAACCRACARAPAWAVEEACGRFLENRVRITWDFAKRPTPPQILAEALHCTLPIEAELHKLTQVLNAEVVDVETSEDERKQALAAWAEIRRGITSSNVIAERDENSLSRERAEMKRANDRLRAREHAYKASLASYQAKASEESVDGVA